MHAAATVAVWMNVPKEQEWEVNDFYELEHTVHVVEVDGFLSGHRYYNAEGRLRFMTLYEAVDEHVEPGPGFQKLVHEPGPRAIRVRKLFGTNTRRINCLLRQDTREGTAGGKTPGGLLLLHSSNGPGAGATAASLQAFLPGALRYRALQSAKDPSVWLEIWDFKNLEAAKAARSNAPIRNNAEVEAYEAIGMPRIKRADGSVVPVSEVEKTVQS